MSSEDYLDAYAKIMKLGLKHKQVRPPLPVRRPPFAQLGSPAASSLCSLPPCAVSATSAKTKQNNKTTFVVAGRWAHGCWRHTSRAAAVRMQSQRTNRSKATCESLHSGAPWDYAVLNEEGWRMEGTACRRKRYRVFSCTAACWRSHTTRMPANCLSRIASRLIVRTHAPLGTLLRPGLQVLLSCGRAAVREAARRVLAAARAVGPVCKIRRDGSEQDPLTCRVRRR